jgi:multisubunit Na+/H+ antiporter MnhC subunit
MDAFIITTLVVTVAASALFFATKLFSRKESGEKNTTK